MLMFLGYLPSTKGVLSFNKALALSTLRLYFSTLVSTYSSFLSRFSLLLSLPAKAELYWLDLDLPMEEESFPVDILLALRWSKAFQTSGFFTCLLVPVGLGE